MKHLERRNSANPVFDELSRNARYHKRAALKYIGGADMSHTYELGIYPNNTHAFVIERENAVLVSEIKKYAYGHKVRLEVTPLTVEEHREFDEGKL